MDKAIYNKAAKHHQGGDCCIKENSKVQTTESDNVQVCETTGRRG
jgi:hypothetical protein